MANYIIGIKINKADTLDISQYFGSFQQAGLSFVGQVNLGSITGNNKFRSEDSRVGKKWVYKFKSR